MKAKSRPATIVGFNPRGLEKKFEEIMGLFQRNANKPQWKHKSDAGDEWASNIDAKMKQMAIYAWPRTKKVGKGAAKKHRMHKTNVFSGNRFWALPYIGIIDNVYRGEGHMQK